MDSLHEIIELDGRQNPGEFQVAEIQQSGMLDDRREVPNSSMDRCHTVTDQTCQLMVPREQYKGKISTKVLAFENVN